MRNEEQNKGSWEQLKGEAKKQLGKLTDNETMEADGRMDKGKGKVIETYGDVKETFAKEVNTKERERESRL